MKTYIISRKIIITPVEDNKDKRDEIYNYLRNAITAQNKAFNLLLTKTASAILDNKSKETLDNIYFSYSHQSPDYSLESEKTLNEMLSIAPITEEIIETKISELKEFLESKGKSEKSINKSCEKKRKIYTKFIGKSKEDIQKDIDRLQNYCAYPPDVYDNFANGLSTPSYVMQQVKKYWKSSKFDVINGQGVRTIRLTNPLIIPPNIFYNRNDELQGIVHDYQSNMEFYEHLYNDRNLKVYFSMPYKKGEDKIKFQLILGNPHKSHALRNELENIFMGIYKIRGSSIGFTKNKETKQMTDLCLYLTIEIPQKELFLNEDVTMGIDRGQAIPAVCALSNNPYERKYIGSFDDFFRVRQQMQKRRIRLQKSLTAAKSGHGRTRKQKALEALERKEANFVKTYNHNVSKKIIDFAIKNNVKYINLEYLKNLDLDEKTIRNWSYYQLQTFIEQKAAKYGIEVRYVNPCYTSQVCSNCGHYSPTQRKSQSEFICECCGSPNNKKVNADFNAARNIAKSTLFLDISKDYSKDKLVKEAQKYYGIE